MHSTKRNLMCILILLTAVCLLFLWYSTANRRRIEERNLTYAMDSARQTALRIGSEFDNAQRRVNTYTHLLGSSLPEPGITPLTLGELEENADFDAIRFLNEDGISLTSNGTTADCSDREYFLSAMSGESGCTVVFESRITGHTTMVFYSPFQRDGKVYGTLTALYRAEDYLKEMLETSYFGEPATVFLCTREGRIIASSSSDSYEKQLLPDMLLESGMVDEQTAADTWEALRQGADPAGFICADGSLTDNLCVLPVPGSEYMLVQAFPKAVTQSMVRYANYIGIVLQGILLALFAVYILVVLIYGHKVRGRLEKENRELGYIISGVRTLFARFALADLEAGTYSFLAGLAPERPDFPHNGPYEEFAGYLGSFPAEEEDRQRFTQQLSRDAIIRELKEDVPIIQYEYKLRRNCGIVWEHISVICLERKEGLPSKVLFLRQDVTALKEKEFAVQAIIDTANRKERQYRIAVASSAFCTFEFNLTKDRIDQDISCDINGWQFSLLEKMRLPVPCRASDCFAGWRGAVTEESRPDFDAVVSLDLLRQRFEQGEAEVAVDYWSRIPGESDICVRQSFLMTQDDNTGDLMVMVVSKDITAQVQRQREQTQALQDALMQAQRANNAKTTFLNSMSHDIRTPMNAIIGFTTLAVAHIDSKERVNDCLQKVLSSSNHLLSLINDILDMSRIESGKVQIKEQECNISELIHNLVSIIQPQVKAKQLELFIDTFDVANEDVIADALKLSQVFVNLLGNAVKYTPAGGTVSFRIRQQTTLRQGRGDYVFLVKDNGIGMTPEFVEHIFEPFERESSSTISGIQGTGLGMAITKNIVDMMGGTISVRSEKNKGSEFRVELSLKLQDVEKRTVRVKELEGLRAIVVDDDCDNCESVTRMLQQIGMRAEWTTSGREAVYRAKSAHNAGDSYHTYIIDWQMPEMNGIETCRQIRAAIGNEAPIIILTAYDWTDIEEEAREAGVTAFCAKPLFMSDLKSVLLSANNLAEEKTETVWTQADFGGKRILLVEDNELNLEIAEEILTETGFVVDTAPDGSDAVRILRQSREYYYDAILMDVQMPIMDGYEATRTIRALPRQDVKTLPIIAMTANAMEEDKEIALKSGMNAHIAKPLDITLFLSVLQKYLN